MQQFRHRHETTSTAHAVVLRNKGASEQPGLRRGFPPTLRHGVSMPTEVSAFVGCAGCERPLGRFLWLAWKLHGRRKGARLDVAIARSDRTSSSLFATSSKRWRIGDQRPRFHKRPSTRACKWQHTLSHWCAKEQTNRSCLGSGLCPKGYQSARILLMLANNKSA